VIDVEQLRAAARSLCAIDDFLDDLNKSKEARKLGWQRLMGYDLSDLAARFEILASEIEKKNGK